ncbi:alpha/beta hydrolase [Sphingobium sp. EM0848]|uniref:alpha/beta hydrolase n=1 Tax=Sphingobium sp. EM0848 TaxID=2743473 RepID=UPI00159CBE7B|nr:alpha/beta hydrolase [Sphingobium sp. EM0848]
MSEVDPELLPLVERMPTRPFAVETLAEDRETMRALWAAYVRPTDDGVKRTERFIPGPDGALRVVIFEPEVRAGVTPAMLFIHGGGFVGGTADNGEPFNRRIVAELGIVIVSVDYRLAPETRYPGAIEDCYAALLWMVREAGTLGIDPRRIAVEGVSAGGALAAALALMVRDRGEVSLAFQSLIYPMLDDRSAKAAPDGVTGKIGWFWESNAFGWTSLLGADVVGGSDVSPYASPARATDLAGLPPTYIGAAALDMLVFQNLDYAKRLIAVGVSTQVEVYPGAFHGFDVGTSTIAENFKKSRLAALKRGLGLA